ncbi:MAG: hypothetical protein QW730_05430, partial [Candidatus Nezhaarchaeales archaeon]
MLLLGFAGLIDVVIIRPECNMEAQGYPRGSCATESPEGLKPACQVTLRFDGGKWYRLIEAAHLSRPEDYFSIYQS